MSQHTESPANLSSLTWLARQKLPSPTWISCSLFLFHFELQSINICGFHLSKGQYVVHCHLKVWIFQSSSEVSRTARPWLLSLDNCFRGLFLLVKLQPQVEITSGIYTTACLLTGLIVLQLLLPLCLVVAIWTSFIKISLVSDYSN